MKKRKTKKRKSNFLMIIILILFMFFMVRILSLIDSNWPPSGGDKSETPSEEVSPDFINLEIDNIVF